MDTEQHTRDFQHYITMSGIASAINDYAHDYNEDFEAIYDDPYGTNIIFYFTENRGEDFALVATMIVTIYSNDADVGLRIVTDNLHFYLGEEEEADIHEFARNLIEGGYDLIRKDSEPQEIYDQARVFIKDYLSNITKFADKSEEFYKKYKNKYMDENKDGSKNKD